jgi:hypothetical protein
MKRSISKYTGTYRSVFNALVAPASTQPFTVMGGTNKKIIRLRSIKISGATLTAIAYLSLAIGKYSALPTGGTSTEGTKVPIDLISPASILTLLKGYTAVNTGGTLVGDIASKRFLAQATTPAAAGRPEEHVFRFDDDNAPILRSATEGLGLRFTTAPATAVTVNVEFEWEEETV